MDGPAFVRPAGNGPKGETGTTVKKQKTGGFLRPEGALIPLPQDAAQHRMGVEVHVRRNIDHILESGYFSSELDFFRNLTEVIMPFFQWWYTDIALYED